MKHKRGRQILPIEKKLKKIVRAALIPHAGHIYAGHARYAALRYFKKTTKQIIYLATLHNINPSNKTYILHRDKGFRLGKHNFTKTKMHEHSFDWVHDELIHLFPSAKILALAPNAGVKHLHSWILQYLKKHKDCIFIATVDLIHYGESFHNASYLSYPQQMAKVKNEEALINAAVNPSRFNNNYINHLIKKDRNIVDGPKTLHIFMKVMKEMHYTGRVTDYYDSHGNNKKNLISRYTIDVNPVTNFVSYVSIVYGKNMIKDLFPIDILLALGLLKSIIAYNIHNKKQSLRLPHWSPLFKRTSGVFVGTGMGNQTNCSYGNYEGRGNENSTSTAEKIILAADNCTYDAKNRWNLPYTPHTLDKLSYKIEFLEPRIEWKKYPGHLATKKFKNNGHYGVYLTLPNGKSATYLPVVFRDNPNWTITKVMEKLTEKAEGRPLTSKEKAAWKKGEIKVYTSKSYTWNPNRQNMEIFPPPILIQSRKSQRNNIKKKYHKKTRKKNHR